MLCKQHVDLSSPPVVQQPLTPEAPTITNVMFEDFWNPNWIPSPQHQQLSNFTFNLPSPTASPPQLPMPTPQQQSFAKCNGECLSYYSLSPPLSPSQVQFPNASNSNNNFNYDHSQCGAVLTSPNQSPLRLSPSSAIVSLNQLPPQIHLNIPLPSMLGTPFIPIDTANHQIATQDTDDEPSKNKKRKNNSSKQNNSKTRKKTTRACVYCQRSHSCCDSFRPCSKCLARGIGHLCRDSEPKKTKKKKFLYLLEDNSNNSNNNNNALNNHPSNSTNSTNVVTNTSFSSTSSLATNATKRPVEEKYVTLGQLTQDNKNSIVKINNLDVLFSRRRRPFPKDIRLSFHRLGRKCGWSPELITMWTKVEEFWRYRDDQFLTEQQRAKEVQVAKGFRLEVISRANGIMQLLNDMAEPMIIWSEGMRIYAVNKAAQAFFGRSTEEMTNSQFGYEDDKEDESWDWSPEEEAEQSDNVFRLFDLIHKDDATMFGCSAASDAMSLYPMDHYNEQPDAARGFRMKVRVNLTKRQANNANVVPTLNILHDSPSSNSDNSKPPATDDSESAVCVVTQSHFRDTKGRFLFASCTFVRLDDL
eukprot:TRINITY_DN600_c0_g1_i3.p1 TRINITY_DN600_c0_g1~~TRINITY_DN600_c0_g1_i3.p1  ORF type:complete len:586 (+),score=115.46 TRINITY_DN600_c0_g1_i3:277-2034(+)